MQRGNGHLLESCAMQQGLSRCMAPLMWLDRDEIVEALLLGPTDDGPGMSQHWRKKLHSWMMNWSPRRLRRLLHSPMNAQKSPNTKNQPSRLMHQVHPPSAMVSNSNSNQSQNTRRVRYRAKPRHLPTPNPDSPTTGSLQT